MDGRGRGRPRFNRARVAAEGQVGFLSISQPGTWIVGPAEHFGGLKGEEYANVYYVLCAKKRDLAKLNVI